MRNPDTPGRSSPALALPARRPPVLALVAISALSPFAINAVMPSIPAIEIAFNADYGRVQLILSFFLASIAISQIMIGPISDRFGRRPVLLIGFSIFIAASFVSPYAPTIEALIAIRVVQGAAAASASCSLAPSCATCMTASRRQVCSVTSRWAWRWRRWSRRRSAVFFRSFPAGRRVLADGLFGAGLPGDHLAAYSGNELHADPGPELADSVL
jgi:MFS family permease